MCGSSQNLLRYGTIWHKLGNWVSNEHVTHCQNWLSMNRMNMLDSVTFDWNSTGKEYEKNLSYCVYIYQSIVISAFQEAMLQKTKEGAKLGIWVSIQRWAKNQSLWIKFICQTLFY